MDITKYIYKINNITNRDGSVKDDDCARKRLGTLGRIYVIADDTSVVFVYEPESREIIGKDMLVTSRVLHHEFDDDKKFITVVTENSVYEFMRI